MVTKQEAAAQQIDVAIRVLRDGHLCAAITLSCAGANYIPGGSALWEKMKDVYDATPAEKTDKAADWLNAPANWLKHSGGGTNGAEDFDINKEEAIINVWRGIATYAEVYGTDQLTSLMECFMRRDWQDFARACEG